MIIINDENALRLPCDLVKEDEIGTLIEALENELNYANKLGKSGIGLSAPQIGITKQIAIIRLPNHKINLVNANIDQQFDPMMFKEEGCLSFPGRLENTLRFQEIYIKENLGSPKSFIATGLLAVCIQHELDHLHSTLFMDRKIKSLENKVKFKAKPNDTCPCGKVDPILEKVKKFKKCCGKI